MKTSEQLQDDYDEALFSLYMGMVMREQGESFIRENERLKTSDEFGIPETIDNRISELLHDEKRKKERCAHGMSRRMKRNLLVAACTVVVLFGAFYATSPIVQAWTQHFVTYITDTATNFILESSDYEDVGNIEPYHCKFAYIPEGFACYEEVHDTDMGISIWRFKKDKASITIRVTDAQPGIFHSVDTENADVFECLKITSFDAIYREKYGEALLSYADLSYAKYVDIICSGVAKETVIKIAEGISFG